MVLSTIVGSNERRFGRIAATAPSRGGPAMRRGHRRASAGGAAGVFAGPGRARPESRCGLRRALAPFRCLPALALLLGVLSPFAAAPAAARRAGEQRRANRWMAQSRGYVLSSAGPRNAQGFTTGETHRGLHPHEH